MKKKSLLAALSAIVVLSLVACGTGSEGAKVNPTYKNIEVEDVELVEATDEDVDYQIDMLLSQNMIINEITDRPIQDGDTANIDYVGKIDGVEFEGGSATMTDLVIGSGQFIDGFEDGLLGANIGDVVDVVTTFPEDYGSEELNGKEAVFTVTVNSITTSELPELNDEFVAEVSETATTVEELREEIKTQLNEGNSESQKEARRSQVWTAVIESVEVEEYPEDEMAELEDKLNEQYVSQAEMYGMSIEDFIATAGMDQEGFDEFIAETAKQIYVANLTVEYIGEKEKLELTEEEYSEKIDELVEQYSYPDKETLFEDVAEEDVKMDIYTDAVVDWIVDQVTFVEPSIEEMPEETTEETTEDEE